MTLLLLLGCAAAPPADPCLGAGALSPCLAPVMGEDHYVGQAELYFDTMDSTVPLTSFPAYSELVARWEWPPWLKLTAFGREGIETADALLRLYPSTVPIRDCRAFAEQPFARCRVTFFYEDHQGQPCPIYEEFSFNDQGEVTFIEAWSDLPAYLPMAPDDPWAEGTEVERLSWRIPGLGTPTGRIDLDSPQMQDAAAEDADVADFVAHAEDWFQTWLQEYEAAGDALWEEGCGW